MKGTNFWEMFKALKLIEKEIEILIKTNKLKENKKRKKDRDQMKQIRKNKKRKKSQGKKITENVVLLYVCFFSCFFFFSFYFPVSCVQLFKEISFNWVFWFVCLYPATFEIKHLLLLLTWTILVITQNIVCCFSQCYHPAN